MWVHSQTEYDRLLDQLDLVEFAATKSGYAAKMVNQELRNYENISQTIDEGIQQAKNQIDQSKENLVLAKTIRKNRMEYDVLAKIISAQPDRRKTTDKLDTLKTELAELENSRRLLQRKLDVRRNDFAVLMRSIRELQANLDDEVRVDGDDDAMAETVGNGDGEASGDQQRVANGLGAGDSPTSVKATTSGDELDNIIDDVEMVSADTSTSETEACGTTVSNGTP